MTELLRATADTLAAKEAAAGLDGYLAALRSRPWWRRMVGSGLVVYLPRLSGA